MKVIPVIGDYGQFSRALKDVGVETVLVPFVDFVAPALSLSQLNTQIGAAVMRLRNANEEKSKTPHLPVRPHPRSR